MWKHVVVSLRREGGHLLFLLSCLTVALVMPVSTCNLCLEESKILKKIFIPWVEIHSIRIHRHNVVSVFVRVS